MEPKEVQSGRLSGQTLSLPRYVAHQNWCGSEARSVVGPAPSQESRDMVPPPYPTPHRLAASCTWDSLWPTAGLPRSAPRCPPRERPSTRKVVVERGTLGHS